MAHYAIYVPGLSDHRTYGQNIVIQLWRLFGIRPRYLALGWNKKEGFETKLARLLHETTKLRSAGHSVSLVGVSAGASAVINAYVKSDAVSSVVCICGKVNNPLTVKKSTFAENPDFKESLEQLQNSLAVLSPEMRKKIMSIHPRRDQTVPIADTIIDGAKEKTTLGRNHVIGIFFGIILGARSIAHFILAKER